MLQLVAYNAHELTDLEIKILETDAKVRYWLWASLMAADDGRLRRTVQSCPQRDAPHTTGGHPSDRGHVVTVAGSST